jgi:hypothetical protein
VALPNNEREKFSRHTDEEVVMPELEVKRLFEALEYIERYARYIRVCAEALEAGHLEYYREMVGGIPEIKPPQLDKSCRTATEERRS